MIYYDMDANGSAPLWRMDGVTPLVRVGSQLLPVCVGFKIRILSQSRLYPT